MTDTNGLTFSEWEAAATQGGKHDAIAKAIYGDRKFATLRKAWRDGEDPTEWARHFEIETEDRGRGND